MIAYTINVALRAESVSRVVVSTDDEQIADISKLYGAEVPFLRPNEISGDHSLITDAFKFTLDTLKIGGYIPEYIVYLYPTHLFRTPRLIDFCVDKLINGHREFHTVKCVEHDSCSIFSKDKNNRLAPLFSVSAKNSVKQKFLRAYGTVLGSNPNGKMNTYMHIIDNPISLIDIDTPFDLSFAEEVIKNNLFDFGI